MCYKFGYIALQCHKLVRCQLCPAVNHTAGTSHSRPTQFKTTSSNTLNDNNKPLNKLDSDVLQLVSENNLLTQLNKSLQYIYHLPNEITIQYSNKFITKANEVMKKCNIETILTHNIELNKTIHTFLIKHFLKGSEFYLLPHVSPCATLRETIQNIVSIEQIQSCSNANSRSNIIKDQCKSSELRSVALGKSTKVSDLDIENHLPN